MPALTYPDRVTFHGFQPDDRFPAVFVRLIKEVQGRDSDRLAEAVDDLLRCSSAWTLDLDLTAQPLDLFGTGRPYDCDDLLDFLMEGTSVPGIEQIYYRLVSPEEKDRLQGIVQRLELEPLLPSERLQWSRFHHRFSEFNGVPLVSRYSY